MSPLKIGDKVEYFGVLMNFVGRTGTIRSLSSNSIGAMVKFPLDNLGPRFFKLTNLRKVTNMSIASRVKTALTGLICQAKPSTVNLAARDLLAATILCTAADAAKTRAKKVLIDLGITLEEYRPGSIVAFDDSEFTITAVTKEPSSRLNQALLMMNLRHAGLSQARITSCLNAATMQNKAATSIVVVEK